MAKTDNLTDFLTDVADAIRSKKGTSAKINPQNFAKEIASIETGGGGGGDVPSPSPSPDIPVVGDGKTYLYINIAAEGRMTVPLFFYQSVAKGVSIDWGDGSDVQTLSGTGYLNTNHTYAESGEYTISLEPSNGCVLGLGANSSSYCVMGSVGNYGKAYCNMLRAVEIGKNVKGISSYAFSYCYSLSSVVIPQGVTAIGKYAFYYCYSLSNVVMPEGITSIGDYAFNYCYSLSNVVIPQGVTSIGNYAFNYCHSLPNVVIPQGVTSIRDGVFHHCYSLLSVVIPQGVASVGSGAFYRCYGVAFYDFTAHSSIPTLGSTSVFDNIASDCRIVVPDALYDEWVAAANWSSYASYIVKASEYFVD